MSESKICNYCGRHFEWRKKWALNWESVKYCSSKCSSSNLNEIKVLKNKILKLVNERDKSKTICPSEILSDELKKNKAEMEKVRNAARLLAHENLIIITQKSKPIDPDSFKGPIRLKKK